MDSNYLILPVVIGMIAGISLVAIFSLSARYVQYDMLYRPPPNSEQQKLVDKVVSESKEIRTFLAKFPLAQVYVGKTATCINGCIEKPPLIKNGTRIEFSSPETVDFPSRAHHNLQIIASLDSDGNIEDVSLRCNTGYEHGTGMGVSIDSFNGSLARFLRDPRWAEPCS